MSFEFNRIYNDVIKSALNATLHDNCDYIVFIDGTGEYRYIHGDRETLLSCDKGTRVLGWTELSSVSNIPRAIYLEFDVSMTIASLIA